MRKLLFSTLIAAILSAQQPAPEDRRHDKEAKPATSASIAVSIGATTGWRPPQFGSDVSRGFENASYLGLGLEHIFFKGDRFDAGGWSTCTLAGSILAEEQRNCSEADLITRYTAPSLRVAKGDLALSAGFEEWFFPSGHLGPRQAFVSSGMRWQGPKSVTAEFSAYTQLTSEARGGWAGLVSLKRQQPLKQFKGGPRLDLSYGGEYGFTRGLFGVSEPRVLRGEIALSCARKHEKGESIYSVSYRPQHPISSDASGKPELRFSYTHTFPLKR